ncbi:MAG: M23 family metallopeptidase [Bacteroidales bacterium]|jgi:hypothetical protein|nr:M23 family metallopeptidase [Bacteroidales bacterium]
MDKAVHIIFYFLILSWQWIYCQKFPSNYFDQPLKINLYASGNFAELRSNHFHSGQDIRTNEKTGYGVFAPADGYVSRIKVQAFGGGKNLYIDHPNGYTSVYMHLERYAPDIERYLKEKQYEKQLYELDITLNPDEIQVKRGDIIAYSGNTGGSAGPHLHYEIRKTSNQQTINPLHFGLKIEDTVPPYFVSVMVKGDNYIEVKNENDTITAVGNEFYFCVEGYDKSNGSTSRNGVYSTKVFINDTLLFDCTIDRFLFGETSFVNAIIDYGYYIEKGKTMIMTKRLEQNKFPYIYYKGNTGVLKDDKAHFYKVRCVLMDFFGNTREKTFYLDAHFHSYNEKNDKTKYKIFTDKEENVYTFADQSKIIIPKGALYEPMYIPTFVKEQKKYYIPESKNVPLHKSITVKLNSDNIPKHLKTKAIITRNGVSIGGIQSGRFVSATSASFGVFALAIDTTAPKIEAKNFKENTKLKDYQTTLQIKITDNLSGLVTYNAYLNNEWVLLERDGKTSTFTFDLNELYLSKPVNLIEGENLFRIEARDEKGNVNVKQFIIIK